MSNTKKESLVAKATNLSDLVAYQEGSVVSRTIIDKKAGTATFLPLKRTRA